MLKSSLSPFFGLRESRWLILLAFPAACVPVLMLTRDVEPACYFAAAMLACAWLLRRLDTFRPEAMAAWLVLAVFVAFYFLRYPLVLVDPASVAATHPDTIAPLFLHDAEGLTRALRLSTAAFVVFCVAAAGLIGAGGLRTRALPVAPPPGNPWLMKNLLLTVPLLMAMLAYVAYTYRIGQMGVAPGESLPFRLKGIVFYARHVFIPLLILALIWRASLAEDRRMLQAGLLLLVVHGFSDALLRGSKSSLLLCLLLAIFLGVSGGIRIRRRGVVILAILLSAAILLIPTIVQYRALRIGADAGSWQLLAQAFRVANEHFADVVTRSFAAVYFRIPGIETAWAVGSLAGEPLGVGLLETLRSPFGVTGYLNFHLYGVAPEAYTLYAPGFVGWFYLTGGWPGVVAGSSLLAAVCVGVPQFLYGGRQRWSPTGNTFLLWVLFISLTDGTLDSNVLLIVAGAATLALLALLDRVAERARDV